MQAQRQLQLQLLRLRETAQGMGRMVQNILDIGRAEQMGLYMLGLSLLVASLIVMPSGLVMMVLSPFSVQLARTVGPKLLLVVGAVCALIAACGSRWLTTFHGVTYDQSLRYRMLAFKVRDFPREQSRREHREILDALEAIARSSARADHQRMRC